MGFSSSIYDCSIYKLRDGFELMVPSCEDAGCEEVREAEVSDKKVRRYVKIPRIQERSVRPLKMETVDEKTRENAAPMSAGNVYTRLLTKDWGRAFEVADVKLKAAKSDQLERKERLSPLRCLVSGKILCWCDCGWTSLRPATLDYALLI